MDVNCDACEILRQQGAKRPTCEECLGYEISDEWVMYWWKLIVNHMGSLFIPTGFGGVSVNAAAVDIIANKFFIDRYDLLLTTQIIAMAMNKEGKHKDG